MLMMVSLKYRIRVGFYFSFSYLHFLYQTCLSFVKKEGGEFTDINREAYRKIQVCGSEELPQNIANSELPPTEGQVEAAPFHKCHAGSKSHVWLWNAPEGLWGCLAFWEHRFKKQQSFTVKNFVVIFIFRI